MLVLSLTYDGVIGEKAKLRLHSLDPHRNSQQASSTTAPSGSTLRTAIEDTEPRHLALAHQSAGHYEHDPTGSEPGAVETCTHIDPVDPEDPTKEVLHSHSSAAKVHGESDLSSDKIDTVVEARGTLPSLKPAILLDTTDCTNPSCGQLLGSLSVERVMTGTVDSADIAHTMSPRMIPKEYCSIQRPGNNDPSVQRDYTLGITPQMCTYSLPVLENGDMSERSQKIDHNGYLIPTYDAPRDVYVPHFETCINSKVGSTMPAAPLGQSLPQNVRDAFATFYNYFPSILGQQQIVPQRLSDTIASPVGLTKVSLVAACVVNAAILGLSKEEALSVETPSPFHQSYIDGNDIATVQRKFSRVKQDLRPGAKQITQRHSARLDFLPFPNFRDQVILLSSEAASGFNETQLWEDIANGGLICWSAAGEAITGTPWDMRSWEAAPWFLKKWWMVNGGSDGEMWSQSRWWCEMRGEHFELGA